MKLSPKTVLVVSLLYMGIVVLLHIFGKVKGGAASQAPRDLWASSQRRWRQTDRSEWDAQDLASHSPQLVASHFRSRSASDEQWKTITKLSLYIFLNLKEYSLLSSLVNDVIFSWANFLPQREWKMRRKIRCSWVAPERWNLLLNISRSLNN